MLKLFCFKQFDLAQIRSLNAKKKKNTRKLQPLFSSI